MGKLRQLSSFLNAPHTSQRQPPSSRLSPKRKTPNNLCKASTNIEIHHRRQARGKVEKHEEEKWSVKKNSRFSHTHMLFLAFMEIFSAFSSNFFSCLCFARRIIDDKHRFRCTTHSHQKRRVLSWDDGGNLAYENKRRLLFLAFYSRFSFLRLSIWCHKRS